MKPLVSTALVAFALGLAWPAAAQIDVTVGVVPVTNGAPFYIAKEKGYFKAEGLDVDIQPIGTLGEAAPVLVSGRMQFAAGGLAAQYFISLSQGLPVKIVLSHASSPVYHSFLVRTDLKDQIKTIADLKGRTVAVTGRGSITLYETAKILESVGLSVKDVEIKYMAFNQMPVGFANKAIDAGIMVPPQTDATAASGVAVKWLDPDDVIRPNPWEIAVIVINTDWAAKNEKAAFGFVYALMRGVREYCNAYHGAANRGEVISFITKYTPVKDAALIDRIQWSSSNARGHVAEPSVLDIQDWFAREGYFDVKRPIEQLVERRYVDAANQKFGAYAPPSGSARVGCR